MNIGITQRVDYFISHDEWRDALDQRLVDWVTKEGFISIPIPNALVDMNLTSDFQPTLDKWLKELNIEALLLSGGNNIGSMPQRDLTENYLLSWAEKNRLPVLGICRGMQIMGVWSGSKLLEVDGHVGARHKLKIVNGDPKIWPKSVNSYHNLVLQDCPSSFQIAVESLDGNIEAITHKELPWEGWMWHPERDNPFSEIDCNRLTSLFKKHRED